MYFNKLIKGILKRKTTQQEKKDQLTFFFQSLRIFLEMKVNSR